VLYYLSKSKNKLKIYKKKSFFPYIVLVTDF